MSDGYLMPEIRKSIRLGWAAFGKVENILKNNNTRMATKKKVFNEYVLPVMTHGSETRALNNTIMESLRSLKEIWCKSCSASHSRSEIKQLDQITYKSY